MKYEDISQELEELKIKIGELLNRHVYDMLGEIISNMKTFSEIAGRIKLHNINNPKYSYRLPYGLNLDTCTPQEVLNAMAVDARMNWIQKNELSEAKNVLSAWGIDARRLYDYINDLREIRNNCIGHKNDENQYRNVGDVLKDASIISSFMDLFRFVQPMIYSSFSDRLKELQGSCFEIQIEYGDDSVVRGILKPTKIAVEELVMEFTSRYPSKTAQEISEKLCQILLIKTFPAEDGKQKRIDVINGKIKIKDKPLIIQYVKEYNIFDKTGDNQTSFVVDKPEDIEAKSSVDNSRGDNFSVDNSKGDNSRSGFVFSDRISGNDKHQLSKHEMDSWIKDYNIMIDYRAIQDSDFRYFMECNMIYYMDKYQSRMIYVLETINRYKGNDSQSDEFDFIRKHQRVYSFLSAGEDLGDRENIQKCIKEHPGNAFLLLTKDLQLIEFYLNNPREGLIVADTDYLLKKLSYNKTQYREEQTNPSYQGKPTYQARQDDNRRKPIYQPFEGRPPMAAPLFELEKNGVPSEDEVLETKDIPTLGGFIISQGTKYILIEEIGEGGEGNIYKTNIEGYVAKIFKKEMVTKNRSEKIRLMVSKQPNIPEVCWPIDIATNEYGEFVGYIMKAASGQAISKTIFKKMNGLKNWTRMDLIRCLITIFEVIQKLHYNNILLGDINGGNILVEAPDKVFFVDTDSYQIEKYPCPVGTQLFSPPELMSGNSNLMNFEKNLRTKEQENYALAVLAFMVILAGTAPFANEGGTYATEFRFPQDGPKKVKDVKIIYSWGYIYKPVRQLFWNVFDDGRRDISVGLWTKRLKEYLRDIENSKPDKDSPQNQIFAEYYKNINNSFVENEFCSRCGNPLSITQEEYDYKIKRGLEPWCKDCQIRDKIQNSFTKFIQCEDCNRIIEVSEKEYLDLLNDITDASCERCNRRLKVLKKDLEWRLSRQWTILCKSSCDPRNGMKDAICCSDCNPKYGLRIRNTIPTLSEIKALINKM